MAAKPWHKNPKILFAILIVAAFSVGTCLTFYTNPGFWKNLNKPALLSPEIKVPVSKSAAPSEPLSSIDNIKESVKHTTDVSLPGRETAAGSIWQHLRHVAGGNLPGEDKTERFFFERTKQ